MSRRKSKARSSGGRAIRNSAVRAKADAALNKALNGTLKAYCVTKKRKMAFDKNPRIVKYPNGTVAITGNAKGCTNKDGGPVRMSVIVARDT